MPKSPRRRPAPLPEQDLEHVLERTRDLWEEVRGGRLFIAGGTGFFGCWLLESFLRANERLGLRASALVLTRDVARFRRKAPHLAKHPALSFLERDVVSVGLLDDTFTHVINAATPASASDNEEEQQPWWILDTITEGLDRTLRVARLSGGGKYLFTSSGAVYGPQPPEITHIPEEYRGGPDPCDPASTYAEGKRVAELLCAMNHQESGTRAKVARCFAFIGPHLPLDAHFAAGNFIRDALRGGPIRVTGDGTPYRSYLYAADLAVWLWTILFRGKPMRPYNVGSEEAVTIADLARVVAGQAGENVSVRIEGESVPGAPAERYVPSTRRAAEELGLEQCIGLEEAVRRTLAWHRR